MFLNHFEKADCVIDTDSAKSAIVTAYIEVLSYSKEENTIEADGVVKSSFAKGINGRNVYLKIKDPNGAESTVATVTTETKDGKNGHFSITYTIPDNYDKAGKHQVFVTSDCVTDVFEETFTYYTEEIEIEITKAEIDFNQATVQSGEKAEIKATLRNEISDVYSFTLNFEYDQNSGDLFKDAEITAPEGFGYEVSNESGVYSVKVTAVQDSADAVKTNAISGDILTLKLKSSSKLIGTHELDANGLVLYHPEVISDKASHLDDELEICSTPAVTITEVEKLVVDIQNTINFFDNPSAGGSNIGGVERADECIVSRVGEWTEYDISALSEGAYEVAFFYGSVSDVKFNVLVDGTAAFVANTLKPSGAYGTYKDAVLGRATLDGNQKVMRLENAGSAAAYVGDVTFTRIKPLIVKKVYANDTLVNPDTNKVYRGTDRISVEFNNQLVKETVNETNVVLTDDAGTVIDCELNTDDNKVLIDLKQTLDYGKEYTLKINNLKDKYDQSMSELYTKVISTYDEENDDGSSGIDISQCVATEESFILKGVVLSSNNVGISGRDVRVLAKAEGETEYSLWAEGKSGKDGEFTLSYTFAENQAPGKYYLNIYVEYEGAPFEDEVYYFNAELSSEIAEEFYMLSDGNAVAAKLIANATRLGIDYDSAEQELTDISYVTNKMANKEYQKAIEIREDFLSLVVLEKVNQAADSDAIVEIINDVSTFSDAGEIQREKWDALEDAERETVAENIRNGGRIEEVETLLSSIDNEINKILQERYEFAESHISVSTQNISVGQGAVLSFKTATPQTNVVGIHIEIKYTEAEKALFGTTPVIELSKKLKDLNVNTTNSEGKIVYDITVKQSGKAGDMISKVSFSNEMMKLSYITATGMEGSYNPTISGYISYHNESAKDKQSAAYFADVPFVLDGSSAFTISASGGSGNYEGGGGVPGGNLGLGGGNTGGNTGSGITGGTNADIPPTTTEGLNTLPFNDIENVSWAKDAICALAEKGIISGKGNKTFAPDENVTRAEFCKMIAIAFGLVNEKAECNFDDVAGDAWYHVYIASAKEAGVINGREDNTFSPDATITREEMAAIALRALKKDVKESTEKFVDDSVISDYAKEAVYALKELGIINGVGENMFSPKTVVTRAMAAKVIYMLIEV